MNWLPRLSPKRLGALAHDLLMTAIALLLCYIARFGWEAFSDQRLYEMGLLAALLLPCAAVIYQLFGLYSAVWRFASTPDLVSILKAVTVLAAIMAAFDFATRGGVMVPRTIVGLFWFLAAALLAGPRLVFRNYRDQHLRKYGRQVESQRVPALILGTGRDAEVLIRSLETDPTATMRPVGLIGMKARHIGQKIRNVPILGSEAELADIARRLQATARTPLRLVVTEEALREHDKAERAVATARALGLTVERMSPPVEGEEGSSRPQFSEIDIADMRLKGTVDPRPLAALVGGRRVVVTGGGGLIGSEICRLAARAGCASLLIVENAELALYECGRTLRGEFPDLDFQARLGDVRDRAAIEARFRDFRPDIVFHAAAMKNEATISRQLATALAINVGGTINVADAAIAAGATALVHLSTDQAEAPRSVMGATKRLAELYLELVAPAAKPGNGGAIPTRFVSMRFSNVYSSQGATVSTLRAQIGRGGPVVIPNATDPGLLLGLEEAVARVLEFASDSIAKRGRIPLVSVDLGQPLPLEAVAERMIRLSGLEPGHDVTITVRPPLELPQAASDLKSLVAELSERARREPNVALREILAVARAEGDDETLFARLAQHGAPEPAHRTDTAARLH